MLDSGGIAIVGSRNANENDLRFTKNLSKKIANCARTVISGGARGVDQAAMLGALEIEGTVVGVLADSLSKAVLSQKYRAAIQGKTSFSSRHFIQTQDLTQAMQCLAISIFIVYPMERSQSILGLLVELEWCNRESSQRMGYFVGKTNR